MTFCKVFVLRVKQFHSSFDKRTWVTTVAATINKKSKASASMEFAWQNKKWTKVLTNARFLIMKSKTKWNYRI